MWSPKGWRTELEAERSAKQQANRAVLEGAMPPRWIDAAPRGTASLPPAGKPQFTNPAAGRPASAHAVERVAVWLGDLAKHVTGEDMGPEHALNELLGWAREVFAEHGTEGTR